MKTTLPPSASVSTKPATPDELISTPVSLPYGFCYVMSPCSKPSLLGYFAFVSVKDH